MTNQEILDNAPEGATYVSGNGVYYKFWAETKSDHVTHSLADIRRIVTLETMLNDVFLELSNANDAAQCDCANPACESCKEYNRLQQYIADVQVEINQLNGDYGD